MEARATAYAPATQGARKNAPRRLRAGLALSVPGAEGRAGRGYDDSPKQQAPRGHKGAPIPMQAPQVGCRGMS